MLFVGIGGTLRDQSSSEVALRAAMEVFTGDGHEVRLFAGSDLDLGMYNPQVDDRSPVAIDMLASLRQADGVVISSPGYHGGISGLVKNALDYIEDLAKDDRVYLDGRAVGCITVAHGPQAAVSTLQSLRSCIHALRGWPTPYGAAIDTARAASSLTDGPTLVAHEVLEFAKAHSPSATAALASSAPCVA